MSYTATWLKNGNVKIKAPNKRIVFVGTFEGYTRWLDHQFPEGKEPKIEVI